MKPLNRRKKISTQRRREKLEYLLQALKKNSASRRLGVEFSIFEMASSFGLSLFQIGKLFN